MSRVRSRTWGSLKDLREPLPSMFDDNQATFDSGWFHGIWPTRALARDNDRGSEKCVTRGYVRSHTFWSDDDILYRV